MKIKVVALLLVLAVVALSGCSIAATGLETTVPDSPNTPAPGKMVEHIDITFQPDNPTYTRHYSSEANVRDFLILLRSLQTNEYPDQQPNMLDGQSYFVISLTYANEMTQHYHLMGHRYLRTDNGQWREIGTDNAKKFVQFLEEHPNDVNLNHIRTISEQKTAMDELN